MTAGDAALAAVRRDYAVWRGQVAAGMLTGAVTVGMVAGGSLALWGLGGGLILLGLSLLVHRRLPAADWRLLGGAAVLTALVIAGDLNAPVPARSLAMSWRLLTIVVPLLGLLHVAREPVRWPRWFDYVGWAALATTLLLLAEFLTQGQVLLPLFHFKNDNLVYYDRGLSYAVILFWPLAAHMVGRGQGRLALMLWAVLATTAWCSASRGAPLALAVGSVFALLGWRTPRLAVAAAVGMLTVMAAGILLLTPWIFAAHPDWLGRLPVSWHHRFEIWDYLMLWNQAAPWVGHGLDTAGIVQVPIPPHAPYLYATGPAAHPHHAALQLWLELGPAGWLAGVALAVWGLMRVSPAAGMDRAAGLAAWAGYMTLLGGAFSLWTDSFLALAALTVFWSAVQRPGANSLKNDALTER